MQTRFQKHNDQSGGQTSGIDWKKALCLGESSIMIKNAQVCFV